MVNAIGKSLISYLIIASIFITGNDLGIASMPVYWYYPVHAFFAVFCLLTYQRLNIKVLLVWLAFVCYVLFSFNEAFDLVAKQLINISFSLLVFYCLIVHEGYDLQELFRKYITVAKVLLVIGFIQMGLFLTDRGDIFLAVFPFLGETNITERFQSLTAEPSFVALTFAPVVFLAVYNLIYRSHYILSWSWSILFILGYVCTFALSAFIGLFAILVLVIFKKTPLIRKIQVVTISLVLIFGFGWLAYNRISYIRQRVDDTWYGFTSDFTSEETYQSVNLSTYAFLSNFYVVRQGLKSDAWVGNGLGTHERVYDRVLPEAMQSYSTLNRLDANSLALRIVSETGLVGLLSFCFFIFHYRIPSAKVFTGEADLLWILNTAVLVVIVIALLRNGNYTFHGKMLFLLMYYYSFRFFHRQSKMNGSLDFRGDQIQLHQPQWP